MARKSEEGVETLLADLAVTHAAMLDVVQRVRDVVEQQAGTVVEAVKYGGIVFSREQHFCGVFAYQGHVSVEFSQGSHFADPYAVLEGNGKHRRHIKLRSVSDVEATHLAEYVQQALG
jgi:hypothetical protein